jgi:hypothetical protein
MKLLHFKKVSLRIVLNLLQIVSNPAHSIVSEFMFQKFDKITLYDMGRRGGQPSDYDVLKEEIEQKNKL